MINLQHNVSLAPYSTFGIGGLTQDFVLAKTPDELVEIANWANERKIQFKVFAGGSNIVFPDETVKELTIQFSGGKMEKQDGTKIHVDAGVRLAEIISYAVSYGLAGVEDLSGIPGTVGGAVIGNAGAYGHSISEIVESVIVWNNGRIRNINNRMCQFDYRESIFKTQPLILLSIDLSFQKGNIAQLYDRSQYIINLRREKYHPGLRCPGSFFKNVQVKKIDYHLLSSIDPSVIIEGKIPAGFLLTEVGSRGMRIGDIQIADFHGNLFINIGKGKAQDVRQLAQLLKKRVYERFGILLEEEIRYF